jgi:hypothetical protein
MRRCRHQFGIEGNFIRDFAHDGAIGADEARFNGGLCLGAALEQAALDQQSIGAQTTRHVRCGNRVARKRLFRRSIAEI